MNLKIISAGAGSGKTYRLTQEMVALLNPENPDRVRASGIIATPATAVTVCCDWYIGDECPLRLYIFLAP